MVITKPGLATVRLGPFAGDVWAERAAGELRLAAASAAPAGTAVELVAYDPARPHQPLAVPTDPAGLGELMEQMPAGDGTGRDFPDLVTRLAAQEGYGPAARLRAVATGLCRPDEEIAEHLRATRSPRFHTGAAGAALVWTECGREVDPEQVDCETTTCRRCGKIDRQLRHDARADAGAVSRDGDAPRRLGRRDRRDDLDRDNVPTPTAAAQLVRTGHPAPHSPPA